jgi:hypothetical protein
VDLTDHESPNQRRKRIRRERRATRQELQIPASGVDLEAVVDEFLEVNYG